MENKSSSIPKACACAEVGGKLFGVSSRVKDFEVISLDDHPSHKHMALVVACGSDGAVRLWSLAIEAFEDRRAAPSKQCSNIPTPSQEGKLLGAYETGNRITCMIAFLMQKPEDPAVMSDFELEEDEGNGVEGESSSDEAEE